MPSAQIGDVEYIEGIVYRIEYDHRPGLRFNMHVIADNGVSAIIVVDARKFEDSLSFPTYLQIATSSMAGKTYVLVGYIRDDNDAAQIWDATLFRKLPH